MPSYYNAITEKQAELIQRSRLFFVATADPQLSNGPEGIGPLNLSPKGGVPLHIISPTCVAFLDYAGSGNETARHSLAGGPITLMVCSMEEADAAIVRLYGHAKVVPLAESPHAERLLQTEAKEIALPTRQVIEVHIEKTLTSCGYGVPVMHFVRERRKADRGRRYKA